jgi:hypothetical protein
MSHLIPGLRAVSLTSSGSYTDRVSADAKLWEGIKLNTLYAFNGTRILGMSLASEPRNQHILDSVGHGTATAGLVARYDPNAIIVMIQVDGTFCVPPVSCLIDPAEARAIQWAADQPWIDVISVSIGVPGDIYDSSQLHPETKAFVDATRSAADHGKIVVIAAGNTLAPSLTSYMAAPPWVICVGGAEVAPHGEAPLSNKMVDVVANFTDITPSPNDTSSMEWHSGTSLSTPIVAASLSRAIYEARAEAGQAGGISNGALVDAALPNGGHVRVTSNDFRSAMNASAVQWKATDWDPTKMPTNQTINNLDDPTDPMLVGPAQMGWGYVNSSLSDQVAKRATAHDFTGEDMATSAYMAEYEALREQLWG